MLNKILSKYVSKFKNSEFHLDEAIATLDLIAIVRHRLMELIRGFFKGIGLKGNKKRLLVGKKTMLLHKSHIKVGKSVQINDYVEINGLSKNGVILGDNVKIGKYSIIRGSGSISNLGKGIKFGKGSCCGDYCFFGCSGGIEIGEDVIMGQNVRFHSQNHKYEDKNVIIKNQGVVSKGIKVGNNCWIGSGCVILDGVTIGNGCVLGANTLVTKDIEDNSVVVGQPARVIKKR